MHLPIFALALSGLSLVSASPFPASEAKLPPSSKCGQTIQVDGEPWTLQCGAVFSGGSSGGTTFNHKTYKSCFNYCGEQADTVGASFIVANQSPKQKYACICWSSVDGTSSAPSNYYLATPNSSG